MMLEQGGFQLFNFDNFQAQIQYAINKLITGHTNPNGDPIYLAKLLMDQLAPGLGTGHEACNWPYGYKAELKSYGSFCVYIVMSCTFTYSHPLIDIALQS